MLGEMGEEKLKVCHVILWPERYLLLGEVLRALLMVRSFWSWRSPDQRSALPTLKKDVSTQGSLEENSRTDKTFQKNMT